MPITSNNLGKKIQSWTWKEQHNYLLFALFGDLLGLAPLRSFHRHIFSYNLPNQTLKYLRHIFEPTNSHYRSLSKCAWIFLLSILKSSGRSEWGGQVLGIFRVVCNSLVYDSLFHRLYFLYKLINCLWYGTWRWLCVFCSNAGAGEADDRATDGGLGWPDTGGLGRGGE